MGSKAGNSGMPKRSQEVLPLSEQVKVSNNRDHINITFYSIVL